MPAFGLQRCGGGVTERQSTLNSSLCPWPPADTPNAALSWWHARHMTDESRTRLSDMKNWDVWLLWHPCHLWGSESLVLSSPCVLSPGLDLCPTQCCCLCVGCSSSSWSCMFTSIKIFKLKTPLACSGAFRCSTQSYPGDVFSLLSCYWKCFWLKSPEVSDCWAENQE